MLKLSNICKSYAVGDQVTHALRGISLEFRENEFVSILGPSGCGKTTTLRIIAGLTQPDEGRVYLGGRDVTNLPPEKRSVNTVFQNYALFPHMTVEKNIAYGLALRKVPRAEQKNIVKRMLTLVALEGYAKRMPSQLSGGQRQRVAIARAVALQPDILLLDEPLGALDLKLRRQMQSELKRIQTESGISFVYITHDQEEALNMSDRIAVMNGGHIEQIGTPEDVYERPRTRFAARFMGETTLFEGKVLEISSGLCRVETPQGIVLARVMPGIEAGYPAAVSVHAESVELSYAPRPGFTLSGQVIARHYAGSTFSAAVALKNGLTLNVHAMGSHVQLPEAGAHVFPCWIPECATAIPGRADS